MSDNETLPPLPDRVSALVQRARDDLGSPREVAELHSRVDRELGPGGGPGGSAPGWVFPMLAAAVVLLGFAGFQVMVGTGAPPLEPTTAQTVSLEAVAAPPAPILAEASNRAAPAERAEPEATPLPILVTLPNAAPNRGAQHEPRRAASSHERRQARASPELAAEAPPAEDSRGSQASLPNPREETQLLDRARAFLRNDAAAALELTREHERRFSRGLLVQEREVIAIDALLRAGQPTEAQHRAARFRERFPTSALSRRVDALFSR
jgi:hypothetical protein